MAGLIGRFDHSRPGQRRAGHEGMIRSTSIWAWSSDRPSVIAAADFHTRMRWSGPLAMSTPVVAGGGAVTVSDARRTSHVIMMSSQDYPIPEGVNWTLVGWTLVEGS